MQEILEHIASAVQDLLKAFFYENQFVTSAQRNYLIYERIYSILS